MFSSIFYIPDRYKTHEMCDRIISEDPFSIRYISKQYITQQMCDEAVDDCLAVLKFVPDCFFTAFYADENILYLMMILALSYLLVMEWINIDLNNINLDNTNYDEDDPDTIIPVRLLARYIKFEKHKGLKKR